MTLRKQKANLENGTVARDDTCAWCVCQFVQALCGDGEGGVSRGDRAIKMHTWLQHQIYEYFLAVGTGASDTFVFV